MSDIQNQSKNKEYFDSIIVRCIKLKLSLKDTKNLIEDFKQQKLVEYDNIYVEDKYLEIIVKTWLIEEPPLIRHRKNPYEVLNTFKQLKSLNTFEDCRNFLGDSKTTELLADINKTVDKLKTQEKQLVRQFSYECLLQVDLESDSFKEDLQFIKFFIDCLKYSDNLTLLWNVFGIDTLPNKDNESVKLKHIFDNIYNSSISNVEILRLKTAVRSILKKDDFSFTKVLWEIISDYLKPACISDILNIDGRKVVEVSGKHLVFSDIVEKLELVPRFSEVEEVRFVKADAIHANSNLNESVWHGKNIVVYCETLIVSKNKKVVWNVSGRDAVEITSECAGTGDDGNGLAGINGNDGESGGNVVVMATYIRNSHNLTIVSKGGRGGTGQDGGKGMNGKDGEFIEKSEFTKQFPPVSKFLDKSRLENLNITMKSVHENLLSVEEFVLGSSSLGSISNDTFSEIMKNESFKKMENLYFEVTTKNGCKITFSFYSGSYWKFSPCQSFLLHRGAEAQAGFIGGSPGSGGKGGFAGEINVIINTPHCLTEDKENGEEGANGNPGSCGKPGRNGADRAYTDCSVQFGKRWPNIVTPSKTDNKRLKISKTLNKSIGIYCPFKNCYVEITDLKELVRKHLSCLYQSSLKSCRKQETRTRKKTINKDCIRERYKDNSNTDFFKMEQCILKAKENLEKEMSKEVLQTENVISKCKVMKKLNYQSNHFIGLIPVDNILYDNDIECAGKIPLPILLELVNGDKENIQLWFTLIKENLNITEMQDLANKLPENEELKFIFFLKYQLVVFDHVETNLNQSKFNDKNASEDVNFNTILSENICKGLITLEEQDQPNKTVEKYFFEDSEDKRKEFIQECKEQEEEEAFRACMLSFIEDFVKPDILSKNAEHGRSLINIVSKRYKLFDNEKNEDCQIKLIPVKNILNKTENHILNKYMIESLVEKSFESKIKYEKLLSKSMQNNEYFKYLSQLFFDSIHKHYDWANPFGKDRKKNYQNHDFKAWFEQNIIENGPNASFYKVFLAYLYRTNILIYSLNEKSQIVLVDSYNPKAKNLIHILWKENKFLRLSVNNDFADMLKVRKIEGELYSKLRYHIGSIKGNDEFNKFVSKRAFLLSDYKGVDKTTRMQVRIDYLQRQDEDVRIIADSFQSEPHKSLIRERLERLKYDVSGYEDVLYFMAMHFQIEANQISVKELCFVINCVLKAATDGAYKMSQISWAIAVYHQTLWLVELTLLELISFFKTCLTNEQKLKWRLNLQRIKEKETLMLLLEKINSDNKSTVTIQCVEETVCLISKIPKAYIGLDRLDLGEWKYYLKDRFWIYEIRSVIDWTEDELKLASYHLVVMENLLGIDKCNKFVNLIKKHRFKINCESARDMVFDTMRMMTSQEIHISEKLLDNLCECNITEWKRLVEKEFHLTGEVRNLSQLRELIENSTNTSEAIQKNMDKISSCVNDLYKSINKLETHCSGEVDKLKQWIKQLLQYREHSDRKFLNNSSFNSLYFLKEIKLATVVTAINMNLGIKLRETQILAIMTMLRHKRNVMSQVSTGEGKTLIVVALAIMKAISGMKVDIITSSKVLAERDAEKHKNIYNLFNIRVGHNCSEDVEERKKAYSNNQVVYGELVNFQRDYLLDRFYNDNILGDRAFETVIVDEVDSMLLDKGNNILYLSHDIPGMDKLEPLFLFIWMKLNIQSNTENTDPLMDIADLKGKILYDMYGNITKDHIKQLDKNTSEEILNTTWQTLIDMEIIDSFGHVMKHSLKECTTLLEDFGNGCIDKAHLHYLFKKVIGRNKSFEIPNYLMKFVESHLDEWIHSAIRAISMDSGIDYVIDVDRSGTSSDRNPNITIVDRDTGTDLINSQWDAGLHQFLQIKHGCRLSLMSLKAVFVSNVTYFKLYKTLYGLTGTLGSKRERELLQEIYDVDFVVLPTSKPKHFNELIPILCSDVETWLQTIFEEVYKVTETRSALVICETVNDVLTLKERFSKNTCFSQRYILTYKRDYEDFEFASNLEPGSIIISTNLAGRGTDIKLSKKLIEAGGLHVCLTFLPSNSRVEEQAYGRAARNGEPGSAQLIFCSNSQSAASKIVDLKKQRDVNELLRTADIKKYHESQIEKEEIWFDEFKKEYDKLKSSKHEKELKSVLLQVCLDKWSFWLDENSKNIGTASIKSLKNSIQQLCKLEFDIWNKEVKKDPFHLIKLGLLFTTKKQYESAAKLFSRVIEEEPSLSEIAYYYRAYAKVESKDCKPIEILDDLEKVANQLKVLIMSCSTSAHIIDRLKKQNPFNILQIESYKEQQLSVCRTYETILHSIYDIIGSKIEPYSFYNPTEIDEPTADTLYHDLRNKNILTREKVKPNISESDLIFSIEYGLQPEILLEILKKQKKDGFDCEQLLKELKNEVTLPSANLFWNELIKNRILLKEESFIFIDKEKLRMFDPSLHEELVNYNELLKDDATKLWLWSPKERFSGTEMIVVKRPIFDYQFECKYQLFKKKGIMFSNKRASFASQRIADVEFCYFDALSLDDFINIGIDQHVAKEIIKELKDNYILGESHDDKSKLKLLLNPNDIRNIQLSIHKAYSDVVKSLLQYCFAFSIAFQYIQVHQDDSTSLSVPLKMKLHRSIINELRVREIIKKSVIDDKADIGKLLKTMYCSSMTKQNYKHMFKQFYDDDATCCDIVEKLIKNGCLVKKCNVVNKLKSAMPKYKSNVETIEDTAMLIVVKEKINNLPDTLSETTIQILTNHLKLVELTANKTLQNLLESSKGSIYTVETPSFSLVPLKTALENNNSATSECGLFNLNGFDQVLKLGEKKYTFKMKVMVFSITMLGITEIATGAFLQLVTVNPVLGSALQTEGIGDLIFAMNCLYTGYCTWRDFFIDKLINVTLTVTTTLCSLKNVFSSNFGEKSSGLWQSVKHKCSTVFNKTKDFLNKLVGRSTPVDKSILAKALVKRVVTNTVQGFGLGLAYSAADHVIQVQSQRFSEAVTEVICANIDGTVELHDVSKNLRDRYVEELHRKIGYNAARRLVDNCFTNVIQKHQNLTEVNWSRTLNKFKFLVTPIITKLQSSGNLSKNIDWEMAFKIASIIKELIEAVNNNSKYLTQINDLVNEILDDLNNEIQLKLDHKDNFSTSQEELKKDNTDFCESIIEDWKSGVKKLLSQLIQTEIIYPLFQIASNELLSYANHMISRKFNNHFLTDEEVKELAKFRKQYKLCDVNKPEILGNSEFADLQFENHLNILRKQRSAYVFVEMFKRKAPMNTECIKLSCTVILQALMKEGIQIPGLRVILKKDDYCEEFSTAEVGVEVLTVIFDNDKDFLTNVQLNGLIVKDFVNVAYKSIIQNYPQYNGLTADILHQMVILWVEKGLTNIENHVSDNIHLMLNKQNVIENTYINKEIEIKCPYQHFNADGKWSYYPAVDVDLRKEKPLFHAEEVKDYVIQGFKNALDKINNHLFKFKSVLNPNLQLTLSDFEDTQYEIFPQTNRNCTELLDCITTEYKIALPLIVISDEKKEYVTFNITMSLRNEPKPQLRRPNGPHIFYNFSPNTIRHADKGIKGHILLSIKSLALCPSYTAQDCHVAGELILATVPIQDTGSNPKDRKEKQLMLKRNNNLTKNIDEKKRGIRNNIVETFEEYDKQKEEVIKEQENTIRKLKIHIKDLEENKINKQTDCILKKTLKSIETQTCARQVAKHKDHYNPTYDKHDNQPNSQFPNNMLQPSPHRKLKVTISPPITAKKLKPSETIQEFFERNIDEAKANSHPSNLENTQQPNSFLEQDHWVGERTD